MKNFFSYIIVFFMVISSQYLVAQKVIAKGTVKMEITKVTSDDPQMAMGLEMMKGSQTEVAFKDDQYLTSVDMMGGMVKMKILVEQSKNAMNMLMDAMGNKSWIESKLDESQDAKQKEIAKLTKIEYDKNDTKEILGYKCYKMTITNPEMEGITVTGYLTEDIKTKANIIQGFQSIDLPGYAMEFTAGNPKFAMTMTAVDLKDTVDDSKFTLDTKGYKKITMEEFKKSMGGGFGF
ncbi:MAG: hypothetical protein WAT22_02485 [Saprospiraceae bacterium]|jgi:GLPGLI family protein|nr:hypothetical protein [Saprospiraceae bacterium]MBP6448063.1 hypothetical protein [Saprospiraceae bacterium]